MDLIRVVCFFFNPNYKLKVTIFITFLLFSINFFMVYAHGYTKENGSPETTMGFLLLAMTLEIRNVPSIHIPEFLAYTFWLVSSMLTLLMDT